MIELKSVIKIYNNYYNNKVTALKGINLKLPLAGLTFIVGPSGCGKSTLLNILSGVDVQTSGKMFINGVSTDNLGAQGFDGYRNNFVGIIHQDLLLLDHLTLGQNVALALELKGTKPEGCEITELFKKLGLEGMENRYPNQCSIGQCQRVAIARTLIKKPKILVADEPTSSIDQETRMEIYSILKELSKDILVVATTHNREMAERFADRTIVMSDGSITSDIVTGGYNSNIELFDQGKVVAVVPGTVLAADDIDKVNNIIRKNNKKGIYICFETDPARVQIINPNAAKEIVAPKMKEKQKTKDKRKKENLDLIENSEGPGIFQFEKTKLPMKSAWKLSMVNFSSNKLRSIFTVVLSFLAIMFFALTSNLSRVDVNRLMINTFSDTKGAYITYGTDSSLFNETDRYGDNLSAWTSDHTYNKSGLIYDYGKSISTETPDDAKGPETQGSSSYKGNIYGVRKVIVDDTSTGDTNKFGIKLKTGKWATSTTADAKSIVISDFVAAQLQTAYYLCAKNTGAIIGAYVPSFEDMVDPANTQGRNIIKIDGSEFQIIGIYETNFRDYFVFDSETGYLKTYPETQTYFAPEALRLKTTLTKNDKLRAEYLLQNDFVTAFVSADFISKGFLGKGFNNNIYTLDNAVTESDYFITQHSAGAPEGTLHNGIKRVTEASESTGGVSFINSKNFITETDVEPGIIKVSKKFYTEFINDKAADVQGLTIQEGVDRTLTFNISKSNYTYNILRDLTNVDSGANMLESNASVYKYNVLKPFTFEIHSELLDDATYNDYAMMLAEADFDKLMQALVLPSSSFAVSGSYSAGTLQSIFDKMGKGITPSFADSAIIQEHAGSYDSLSGAMITASIALAIFIMALMYNYIFQSIRSKRKSIAVIRSMGARTWDVFKIFILEALVIAGLICFGAFISVVVAAAIGNAIVAGSAGIALLVFRLDVIFLLLLLSVTLLIILASYMVPVFAYSRHTKDRGLVRNINIKSDN